MYRSARITGSILVVLGWVIFFAGIIFMFLGGNMAEIIRNNPQLAYIGGGMLALPGLILVALGEGLRLLVNIAEHTKQTGEALSRLRKRN